ncbi:hypothetical protein I4U23_022432 [Adineta vaga]|nr:hypothetical protein I4U23_022432 [Adineta vaga]
MVAEVGVGEVGHDDGSYTMILFGFLNGAFSHYPNQYTVDHVPWSINVANFNKDQVLDLAVANYGYNTVSIRLGRSNRDFFTLMNYGVGEYPRSVVAGH